jgi:RNA-directed DNA polymerase
MIVPVTSAPTDSKMAWEQINWLQCQNRVIKLQGRIVKAIQEKRWGKVKALQHLLIRSFSAKSIAVKRVTENRGKRTSGIDGQIWSSLKIKFQAIQQLKQRGYKAQPLKRVYLIKPNGKKRPLGIPTMKDRAMQALYLLGLEPISETYADRHSYGFRPKRSCADALRACHNLLAPKNRAQWILEGDIEGCFDTINHEWLQAHIPMNKKILQQWLKAGFMKGKTLYPTLAGTPQGGIISPVLANMTLDGLEAQIENRFGRPGSKKRVKSGVHLIRYADDFIMTGCSQSILEDEVKPLVSSFLKERGLKLSDKKTKITCTKQGFDFLGCTVRRYRDKLLVKPSKGNVKKLLLDLRQLIKVHVSSPQAVVIKELNSRLRGWANYYRHTCAKQTFNKIDHEIFTALWKWSRKRHPNKGLRWIKNRYFKTVKGRSWVYQTLLPRTKEKIRLLKLADTPIQRHLKIRANANPFDFEWKNYFAERQAKTKILRSSFAKENQILLVSCFKSAQEVEVIE